MPTNCSAEILDAIIEAPIDGVQVSLAQRSERQSTVRAVFGYFVHSVKAEIIVAFQVRFHLQNGIQYRVSGRSHFSGTHFF